jgi:hypothetical protein
MLEVKIFHCTENDNIIRIVIEDGEIDEIQVSCADDKERLIVGWEDLRSALVTSGAKLS